MSVALRIILIVVPILLQTYIVYRIRKFKMKAEDALFWLVLSAVLVVLGIFPSLAISVSGVLGIISPANFVFLVIIFLLLYKVFSLSLKLALLERKFQSFVQNVALQKWENSLDEFGNIHNKE